jgi:hypothetical protein
LETTSEARTLIGRASIRSRILSESIAVVKSPNACAGDSVRALRIERDGHLMPTACAAQRWQPELLRERLERGPDEVEDVDAPRRTR